MSCLDNIVSLKDYCSDNQPISLSGYDLMSAPELTPLTLADIANEKYVIGYNVAKNALNTAILDIRNDFLAVLSSNNIVPNLDNTIYETSVFEPGTTHPAKGVERGISLYRNTSIKGSLKKLKIHKVHLFPKVSVPSAEILIYDNGILTQYNVELVANQVNSFDIEYTVTGHVARILLDNSAIPMGGARLICFVGCNGTQPNGCGYTKGYDGKGDIGGKEGFGIGVDFSCECDYEGLLCSLSKSYVGKLIFLKARIKLLDERIYGTRNNDWTAFGKDEAKEMKNELEGEYVQTWNTFVASLPNILSKYRDDCIACKGVKIVTNI
jgi:hypothetical protein